MILVVLGKPKYEIRSHIPKYVMSWAKIILCLHTQGKDKRKFYVVINIGRVLVINIVSTV